jgi:hypothetical protein
VRARNRPLRRNQRRSGHRLHDLNIPQALMRNLDHADCGVYAELVGGGEIAGRDAIEIV